MILTGKAVFMTNTFTVSDVNRRLPRIGITMGDPAGIGPEIVLKSLATKELRDVCTPLVIGDLSFLKKTAENLGIEIELVASDTTHQEKNAVQVEDLMNVSPQIRAGKESESSGKASAEYIEAAVRLWGAGEIDAVATAPISKHAIKQAGYNFPGHTEFLAYLTGTDKFAMSFFAGDLRVVLLSTHVSLLSAIRLVTKERLVDLICFTNSEMSRMLGRSVSIAVAGINPHASENGMFGSEEAAEIVPAISECRDKFRINVAGPFSPDTIFVRAFRGEFDAVIACYHDQATIAVKCLAFGSAVNVTLGLPLIRTSVDHGTAFDIAGTNTADPSSMIQAVLVAAELAGLHFARSPAR